MNNRQRVFEILSRQPGSPLTPEQIVTMSATHAQAGAVVKPRALGLDTVRAALKWLVSQTPPLAQKIRRRRDFGYTLADGATMPPDRRTIEGRINGKD